MDTWEYGYWSSVQQREETALIRAERVSTEKIRGNK
jgi:hypothetical protein